MTRRSDDRLANRAVAAARINAAEGRDNDSTSPVVGWEPIETPETEPATAPTVTNGATYHVLATMAWPKNGAQAMWPCNRTFTTDIPVSRSDVLDQVYELAANDGVPDTANVLFFSVEIDEVTR